jgi:hypothetical protein
LGEAARKHHESSHNSGRPVQSHPANVPRPSWTR